MQHLVCDDILQNSACGHRRQICRVEQHHTDRREAAGRAAAKKARSRFGENLSWSVDVTHGSEDDEIIDRLIASTPTKEDELLSDARFKKIFAS